MRAIHALSTPLPSISAFSQHSARAVKLWSSSLCNVLQPSATSSLSLAIILLSILLSKEMERILQNTIKNVMYVVTVYLDSY
jgi:hypothetical protein